MCCFYPVFPDNCQFHYDDIYLDDLDARSKSGRSVVTATSDGNTSLLSRSTCSSQSVAPESNDFVLVD